MKFYIYINYTHQTIRLLSCKFSSAIFFKLLAKTDIIEVKQQEKVTTVSCNQSEKWNLYILLDV